MPALVCCERTGAISETAIAIIGRWVAPRALRRLRHGLLRRRHLRWHRHLGSQCWIYRKTLRWTCGCAAIARVPVWRGKWSDKAAPELRRLTNHLNRLLGRSLIDSSECQRNEQNTFHNRLT